MVKLKALTEAQWLRDYPNSATAALELHWAERKERLGEAQARNEQDQKDRRSAKLTEELDKATSRSSASGITAGECGADDKKKKKDAGARREQ